VAFKRAYNAPNSTLQRDLKDRYTVVVADVDNPITQRWMEYYGLGSIPTFAFAVKPATRHVSGYNGQASLLRELGRK